MHFKRRFSDPTKRLTTSESTLSVQEILVLTKRYFSLLEALCIAPIISLLMICFVIMLHNQKFDVIYNKVFKIPLKAITAKDQRLFIAAGQVTQAKCCH